MTRPAVTPDHATLHETLVFAAPCTVGAAYQSYSAYQRVGVTHFTRVKVARDRCIPSHVLSVQSVTPARITGERGTATHAVLHHVEAAQHDLDVGEHHHVAQHQVLDVAEDGRVADLAETAGRR